MADSDSGAGNFSNSSVMELTGKIMVATIILLFFVVVFVFCLHLYAKWFWYRHQVNRTNTTHRRRRRNLDFSAGYHEAAAVAALRRGLDPSVLETIPVTLFDPKEFKDGLECAVCLCEVAEGEKTRLMPKCNHGFHVECIDLWFQSHSTCPLCRNPVANPGRSSENSAADSTTQTTTQQVTAVENPPFSTETPNLPTNVLFWGDETQVSTFDPNSVEEDHPIPATNEPCSSSSSSLSSSNPADGILVIDVPMQINEEEEQKSPMPTRLRSLRRLLSGGNRRTTNPSSPRNFDLEQGVRGQS